MYLNKNKFLSSNKARYTILENMIAITLMNEGYNLYYYQSEEKLKLTLLCKLELVELFQLK